MAEEETGQEVGTAERQEAKTVVKGFRLTPSEDALLDILIELAYLMGKLFDPKGAPTKSLQAYIMYALHCADVDLRQEYEAKRGRR